MLKRKKVDGLKTLVKPMNIRLYYYAKKKIGPKGSSTPHMDVVGLGHTCYMITRIN